MNSITQVQQTRLQSAVAAAICKTNETGEILKTRVSVQRAIYDTLENWNEQVLGSEIKEHLRAFGYKDYLVDKTLLSMFQAGHLIRTLLKPYAYTLSKKCPKPSETPIKVRTYTKSIPTAPVVFDGVHALPLMAKFNSDVNNLAQKPSKNQSLHYGCLGSDIEIITSHLSKLRLTCNQTEGLDPELSSEYETMGTNLDRMMQHIRQMESHLLQIAQMAKVIRSNPL